MSVTATMPPRSGLAGVRKPKDTATANKYMPLTPEKTPRSSPMHADVARPTTPTSPVQIPVKARHETAHHKKRHDSRRPRQPQPWTSATSTPSRRSSRDVHSPDAIPPSVAALLAVTSIPPPRPYRSLRQRSTITDLGDNGEKRMTVNSIIERAQEAEQEFSLSLSKSPLDVLLTAPEDLDEDDLSIVSGSTSTMEPGLSTRAVSLESMPSLSDSYAGTLSSCDSPYTPVRNLSSRKARPTRKSMTPVSSPPGERNPSDPLSVLTVDADSDDDTLDFRVFQSPDPLSKTTEARFPLPLKPLKSAFKSNLTASLRALRAAARSFSNLNLTSSIPPEDFLTRSILTIDPRIPYTDERRPPPLEEEPSAALRRYLNPTTNVHIDPRTSASSAAQLLSPAIPAAVSAQTPPAFHGGNGTAHSNGMGGVPSSSRSAFTASIQMQTYRVHRKRPSPPPSTSTSTASKPQPVCGTIDDRQAPGPRQRELRENSDFIRIAVMEMAMRRVGKLDDRKPGRARLALPPRKAGKAYAIGADGVPARWVGITCE